MNAAVAMGVLFGAGALLLLTAQPLGAPRPSIASRIEALMPDRPYESTEPKPPVFKTYLFEQVFRPYLERSGEWLMRCAGIVGLDLAKTDRRLKITGDHGGLGLFMGQKLAAGLVGLAGLPAAASVGLYRPTPVWMWLASGAVWFSIPDVMLASKARTRLTELKEGLARFADLVSLSVSAGLGLEGAMEEVARSADGPFFEQLRRFLRETSLRGEPASAAIRQVAEELELRDAEPLAGALESAEAHGIAVSQVLRAQARAIRDRRRIELVQAGERAQVRMILPVALLILPAFFVLILFPAAIQLLQISAP